MRFFSNADCSLPTHERALVYSYYSIVKHASRHRLRQRNLFGAPSRPVPRTDVLNGPSTLSPNAGRLPMRADGITAGFTMAELMAAVDSEKPGTAPGLDDIPHELFKNCTDDLLTKL